MGGPSLGGCEGGNLETLLLVRRNGSGRGSRGRRAMRSAVGSGSGRSTRSPHLVETGPSNSNCDSNAVDGRGNASFRAAKRSAGRRGRPGGANVGDRRRAGRGGGWERRRSDEYSLLGRKRKLSGNEDANDQASHKRWVARANTRGSAAEAAREEKQKEFISSAVEEADEGTKCDSAAEPLNSKRIAGRAVRRRKCTAQQPNVPISEPAPGESNSDAPEEVSSSKAESEKTHENVPSDSVVKASESSDLNSEMKISASEPQKTMANGAESENLIVASGLQCSQTSTADPIDSSADTSVPDTSNNPGHVDRTPSVSEGTEDIAKTAVELTRVSDVAAPDAETNTTPTPDGCQECDSIGTSSEPVTSSRALTDQPGTENDRVDNNPINMRLSTSAQALNFAGCEDERAHVSQGNSDCTPLTEAAMSRDADSKGSHETANPICDEPKKPSDAAEKQQCDSCDNSAHGNKVAPLSIPNSFIPRSLPAFQPSKDSKSTKLPDQIPLDASTSVSEDSRPESEESLSNLAANNTNDSQSKPVANGSVTSLSPKKKARKKNSPVKS